MRKDLTYTLAINLKGYLLLILYILNLSNCQTPTAEWLLDTPNTATSVNNQYNGGSPAIFTDSNTLGLGANSRFIGNGIQYEGNHFSCTHTPHGNTIDNDVNFSVEFWTYINVLNINSQILCKFYRNGGLLGATVNERFCIGFNTGGGMIARMNRNNYNSGSNVQSNDLTGCQYAEGWNHVTVTFTKSGTCGFLSACNTNIACYVQTDSGLVTTDTATFNDQINDDPSNGAFLCVGATTSNGFLGGYGITDEFTGIMNQIRYYTGTVLTASQAAAGYSTNCQSYCKICQPVGTAPYQCIQQQSKYLQKYDFILPTYPVTMIHSDTSGYGFNLQVNSNFAFTPAYAHNQGLFFDTTFGAQNQYLYSTGSTAQAAEKNTFTIETWIRPTSAPAAGMNLFEKESATNTDYIARRFSSATQMQLVINGQTATLTIGAVTLNQWSYVAIHVVQTTGSQSQICLKFNSVAMTCSTVNAVFAESGTSKTQIGDGFRGFMKSLWIYDYAKEELDMAKTFKTTGCTNNVNGNTCVRCPLETGQCISDCNSNQYVNSTTNGCTDCYASCRTCWAAYYDNCYSCIKTPGTWVFDYIKKCSSTCGDGIKDDYESCDDANTKNGDGCSSTCATESGFSCFGGSFNKADTCRSQCGNGIKASTEACDDGNNKRGDGCDSQCNIETGFTCTTGSPSVCSSTCGDGRRVGSEQCDDTNIVNNDGCSPTCTINTGYNCTGGSVNSKDTCQEICGDGKDYAKYGCDDGNTVNNDGCDQNCRIEVGYTCTGGSSAVKDTCSEICGDGRNFKLVANQCDDGNNINGDGCSSTCQIESGYYCVGGSKYTKDKCQETCGDGLNFGARQCDDGNLINGDGCHSDCTIEIGFACSGGTTTGPDTCSEVCGDGRNFGTSACDDGNSNNGDGCDENCIIEFGFLCSKGDPYTKSVCKQFCNGRRTFAEMCDDGNILTGDGCDECCHREVGFTCTGGTPTTADTCIETCGDGRKLNHLECDDGNLISGDGCSSKCAVEQGWQCTGGTVFTPDICSEICGDGKNLGIYQCDDGNVANNDGCSSNCQVEKGFSCKGGNATKADTCYEICGDGKNMGTFIYQCDDGNTVSGDGCAKDCTIEAGFECAQGNFYTPDLCSEICGDGLNYGKFQCDDGNNQDGDGCTAYCSIEDGYKCAGGSKTSADFCFTLSNPSITEAYFSKNNKEITLVFNETILMQSSWNLTNAWSLEMFGPLGRNNYVFTWNVTQAARYKNPLFQGFKSIIIDFDCEQQLFGNKNKIDRVVININDRQYIRSYLQRAKMINTSAIVYPYGQDDVSIAGATTGLPELVDTLTYSLIYASYGVGFVGAMFGYSMMDVWLMMQGLQQVFLFPVSNLYVPSSLTTIFQISMQRCPRSTAFLDNSADVLTILVYFFVFSMIAEIIRMGFEENKSLNNSLQRVKSSMLPGYISFAYCKIAFNSHLNMRNLNFESNSSTVSSLMAMGFGALCWVYILYTAFQAFKFYREVKLLKRRDPPLSNEQMRDLTYFRGNVLFQEYSMDPSFYPVSLFYPSILMFKLLVVSLLAVSFDTQAQLTGYLIINLLNLTAVLLVMPFEVRLLNAQLIFNEMAVFVIYMQAHMFIPKTLIQITDFRQYAKQFQMIIVFMVGVNACFVIFSKVTQIVKCKSVARSKPNQLPILPTEQTKKVQIKPLTINTVRDFDTLNDNGEMLTSRGLLQPSVRFDTPSSDNKQTIKSAIAQPSKPISQLIDQKKKESAQSRINQQSQKKKIAQNKSQVDPSSYYDSEYISDFSSGEKNADLSYKSTPKNRRR
ncbi:UNKNOWN [Stylonychia lemnae]|uniref:Uncharacterized protein n=1 Tax=Stylonychia lemnae TaxID=5949 RepID=A0A077ZW21_STYLE|nr:UNKNOWN [Stylonychia lemnae]|eukprot:CDW73786.1 UNKNOWN [Stylonychia lemnae]